MSAFIGTTRFSLFTPNSQSFRATATGRFSSEEEYREYLFSDERIGVRADIFLNRLLPLLDVASKHHELRHVLQYSIYLPDKYKQRLNEAVDRYSWLVLDEHDEHGNGQVNSFELGKQLVDGEGVFGHYRVDDDDLLSVNYFDRMSVFVHSPFVGMVISFPKGVTGVWNGAGYENIRETYSPMNSYGLMSVCEVTADGSLIKPVETSHNRADRENVVILDAREISYFWTRHSGQDTTADLNPEDAAGQLINEMNRYPRYNDGVHLEELFPSLTDSMSFPQEKILFEGSVDLGSEMRFKTGDLHGPVTFTISTDISGAPDRHNLLLYFNLIDAEGQRLGEETPIAGTNYSANDKIRHYRYLPTLLGSQTFSVELSLPAGVTCAEVVLLRWGRRETDITVKSVAVTS